MIGPFLTRFVEQFTYAGLLLALLAGSLGAPIPEEPVVLLGGVLAHQRVVHWWLALPICVVGVLTGDIVLYWIGHHWGERVLSCRWVRRILSPERAAYLAQRYHDHGAKLVFAARHIAGLRAPAFLMAGTVHLPFWRFLTVDAGAALVGVPTSFAIAYFLTDHLTQVMAGVHRAERWVAVVAVLAGVIAVVVLLKRRSKALMTSAVLAALLLTSGCGALRLSSTTDRLTTPPLCLENAVVVTGPWRDRVNASFDKIYSVASHDLGGLRVKPVAVRAKPSADPRDNGFAICREGDRAAITMPEARLQSLVRRPDGEIALGRAFAHLLAHLALHPTPAPRADTEAHARAEEEADELGVYYFERAGYDCRRWESPGEYLPRARVSCNLAKQGVQLRIPHRSDSSR